MKLNGKYNQDCKIFTNNIEEAALSTIQTILDDEVSFGVPIRIMPDSHQGKDIVIGFTMPLTDRINPNHIGVDIGCSVSMVTIRKEDLTLPLDEIDSRIRGVIPMGFARNKEPFVFNSDNPNLNRWIEEKVSSICEKVGLDERDVWCQIGSLGGGNHFIELGEWARGYSFFVHTGSRNFGKRICEYHSKKAKSKGSNYLFGDDMNEYLDDIIVAQTFAYFNHSVIIERITDVLKVPRMVLWGKDYILCEHNYIGRDKIIRKGAISAHKHEFVLIPMNMRDGVILAKGKGNKDWNYSAPHGAGRIYSRSKAKKELSLDEFNSEMEGIFSTSVCKETLDESPMAYKPMEEILDAIGDTIEIIDIIKPILNIKAI